MRILDVGPWIAYPPERGRAVRAYNLLRRLALRHDVRQWGRGAPRLRLDRHLLEEVPVTPMFRVYRCHYPLAATAQEWLLARQPERGLLESAARRLACPPRLRELLDWAGVIVAEDPHDLVLCRRERPDGRFAYVAHDLGGPEAVSDTGHDLLGEAVSSVEAVIALSAADRQDLIDRYGLSPESVVEVPNGADVEACRPVDDARRDELRAELRLPGGELVVFVGSATPANRAALGWIRRLAATTGRFIFVVVGGVGVPERSDQLVVTGTVKDVVPYLQAADLALCPVEYGTGTPIKLFEGLACGLATVVFAEVLRGTELQPDRQVIVSEKTERALLAALEDLVADREAARALGAAGRSFVAERHSWDDLAQRLDIALRSRFDSEYGRGARHTFATSAPIPHQASI